MVQLPSPSQRSEDVKSSKKLMENFKAKEPVGEGIESNTLQDQFHHATYAPFPCLSPSTLIVIGVRAGAPSWSWLTVVVRAAREQAMGERLLGQLMGPQGHQ